MTDPRLRYGPVELEVGFRKIQIRPDTQDIDIAVTVTEHDKTSTIYLLHKEARKLGLLLVEYAKDIEAVEKQDVK